MLSLWARSHRLNEAQIQGETIPALHGSCTAEPGSCGLESRIMSSKVPAIAGTFSSK